MKYIGSKLALLPFLENSFNQVLGESDNTLCDMFAGTGRVGRHFKQRGYQVIANDLQYYSYAINKGYLKNERHPTFSTLLSTLSEALLPYAVGISSPVKTVLNYLNDLPYFAGFVTLNYSAAGGRMYFTEENAKKIDAIRAAIENWKSHGLLIESEYYYLLASLLEATGEIANTTATFSAYLKHYKTEATKYIYLKPLKLPKSAINTTSCRVYNKDANELIHDIQCDVLYLDPPTTIGSMERVTTS